MTTLNCTECSEPRVVTSRSVVLPFVCEECQKAPELLAAMAPTTKGCGNPGCDDCADKALVITESDNIPCDSATIENTTLLIEDQANQLALALNEVDALRQVNQYLEARESELVIQNDRLRENVENLLVKNFFKDEKITKMSQETFGAYFESFMLKIVNSKQVSILQQLRHEFEYVAKRFYHLAAEYGKMTHERDVWQKRALLAKRCYDRASADRRYYRGKLKDAGIKA